MLKLDVTQLSIFFVTGIFYDKDHKIFFHLFLSYWFLANFCENILSVARRNKKRKDPLQNINYKYWSAYKQPGIYILKMVTDDYKWKSCFMLTDMENKFLKEIKLHIKVNYWPIFLQVTIMGEVLISKKNCY